MTTLRTKNRVREALDTVTLDLYGSPEGYVTVLTDFLSNHTDSYLDFECDQYYGSSSHNLYVKGWRRATAEEKAADRYNSAQRLKSIKAQKQADLDRARKLLQDAGEL